MHYNQNSTSPALSRSRKPPMRHFVCAALLAAAPCAAGAQDRTVPVPPNVVVDGVTPIPQGIADALAPYAGKMVKMWVGPYYVGEVDPREWPYQRAFDLYLDGKLDAACAGFQKIVESRPPTHPEVYTAEAWMGAIQRRLGCGPPQSIRRAPTAPPSGRRPRTRTLSCLAACSMT